MPPGKAGESIGTQLPQSINAVLKNVGGSALIAFYEGSNGGILFFTQPRISELHIILVLCLAKAEVGSVFFVLAAKVLSGRCPL